MEVFDLSKEHEQLYCLCLEDWSQEAKEAGPHRACWYAKMKERGLRVKLAKDDAGNIGGMIHYLPIEYSFVDGKDLFFIPCIWVHGHKQGRGNFQGKGLGAALLEAAETDAKRLGAKGMAAWGLWLPVWMRASWFKKHGYRKADRIGMRVLVWKPFTDDAQPPKWFKPAHRKPDLIPSKVTVTSFLNGWCMAMNLTHERAKRASSEFGDKVVYRVIDMMERDTISQWGFADAIYVDDKEIPVGPPPSYEKIRKIIARRVKKLKH